MTDRPDFRADAETSYVKALAESDLERPRHAMAEALTGLLALALADYDDRQHFAVVEEAHQCAHQTPEYADWPMICGEGCVLLAPPPASPTTMTEEDARAFVRTVSSAFVAAAATTCDNPRCCGPLEHAEAAREAAPELRGFAVAPSRATPSRIVIDTARRSAKITMHPSWEALRKERGWPTPNHLRRAADSLDGLTPAAYGDLLRYVADACDGLPETPRVAD